MESNKELEPWEIAEDIWEEEIGDIERAFCFLFEKSCTLEEAVSGADEILDKYKRIVAVDKERNKDRNDKEWQQRNYYIQLRREFASQM